MPTRPLRTALCVALLPFALACSSEAPRPAAPVRAIKWQALETPGRDQVRRLSGVVQPVDQSELSFEVAGRVESVAVDLGDRVSAGDVLAQLDPRPFELQVRKAEAAVKESEARRWRQRADFERAEALYAASAASRSELDRARASFESAESRVRAARAELSLARRDLGHATLTAPFDGVISIKEVDRYVEVSAGAPVFELDSESRFEIVVGVPDRLIDRLRPGQTAAVQFSPRAGLRQSATEGRVSQIGSRALAGNTFPVKLELPGALHGVRAGMSAEVAFEFASEDQPASSGGPLPAVSAEPSFMLPLSALLAGANDQHFVFVFDEASSRVARTPVRLRDLRGNEVEVVGGGLAHGRIVATAGVEFLADDQTVKLLGRDG